MLNKKKLAEKDIALILEKSEDETAAHETIMMLMNLIILNIRYIFRWLYPK